MTESLSLSLTILFLFAGEVDVLSIEAKDVEEPMGPVLFSDKKDGLFYKQINIKGLLDYAPQKHQCES